MKIAIVLPHGGPSSAARIGRGYGRRLAAGGASVDLLLAHASPPGVPSAGALGERPLLEGATAIDGAIRAGTRHDVAIALGWEAFYAMLALEAACRIRLVLGDERRPGEEGAARAPLIERSIREPGVGLITDLERRRAWLLSEHGRDARVVPGGVERAAFAPPAGGRGRPREGPVRVLIEGRGGLPEERLDEAFRVAAQVPGIEVWHVATDGVARPAWRAARRMGPLPLDAMPEVYRSCDVLLRLSAADGASLTPLEMMAAGGAVVVARGEGRRDLLRDGENALVPAIDDDAGAVRALRRIVEDGALRARLAEAGAATAAAMDASAGGPLLEGAIRDLRAEAEARPLPPERRRELAATGDLLRRERAAQGRARDLEAALERSEPWPRALAAIGRRAARRAAGVISRLHATPGPGARGADDGPGVSGARGGRGARGDGAGSTARDVAPGADLRPGEPVIFAGQPRYFRAAYHDAVLAGWGIEAPLRPGDAATLDALPALAAQSGAGTCVVFEPDLAARRPDALGALAAQGVRLVGYSTEPVPRTDRPEVHPDQLRRLEKLRRARDLGWDLIVHFDAASLGFLRAEGFAPLAAHPLPVSESLFFPEGAERDIDVCFLGRSTPHREAFLAPLEGRFRAVHVAHGLFDEEARRLMCRSRVVVNIHCHGYPTFETRAAQALFCGRPLVSEDLGAGPLEAGRDYALARSPEEMADEVAALLRGERGDLGRAFDRAAFRVAALRDLLASAGAGARAGGQPSRSAP